MTSQTLSNIPNPTNTVTPERTLSDLIVDYLEALGVDYVFGIPGGHNSGLYEALARSEKRGKIRAILTAHETGAAYMADGYWRETGKIGVCCGTTGPGTTNFLTGVASAYGEGVPLLLITAQTMLSHFSWGAFQESSPDTIDALAMFNPCTRYNSLVTHPNQLERKLVAALSAALRAPKGPAHLSIPVNLFRAPAEQGMVYGNICQLLQEPAACVDLAALDQLWQRMHTVLQRGQKIVFWVGQDGKEAGEDITTLAELLKAPIVTSQGGKSAINPYHPLAQGVFGFAGHLSARQALTDEAVGLILAVGLDLWQWETSTWDKAVLTDKIVHIHDAHCHFITSPMAQLQVQGTIKTIFKELKTRLETTINPANLNPQKSLSTLNLNNEHAPYHPPQIQVREPQSYQHLDNNSPIKPQQVIAELIEKFPPETRYLIDVGNWLAWSIHYLFPPRPENYRLAVATAPMGWGIGSALGTAFGVSNTPIVCLTGDGCFLMHGNELALAVKEKLPIIFIILNDRSYGMVKHRYRQTGTEPLEFALPSVDYSQLAKAMGAKGHIIRNSQDLKALDYAEIYNHSGPTVLDLQIDPEDVPPIGMF